MRQSFSRNRIWTAIAGIYFLGACTADAELPLAYTVVTNPPIADDQSAERWSGTPVLQLGSADGGDDVLGRIVGFELGPGGVIHVADGQAREVRTFTPSGRLVRILGGAGEGPGEFRMLSGIVGDSDGRLWAFDPSIRRVTVFDSDGGLLSTFPHREDSHNAEIPWGGMHDGTGRILEMQVSTVGTESAAHVVAFEAGGDRFRPAFAVPLPPRSVPMIEGQRENIRFRAPVPFTPLRRWSVSPSGTIWLSDMATPMIVELTHEGDTTRVISLLEEPPPLSRHDLDSLDTLLGLDPRNRPATRPSVLSLGPFGPDAMLVVLDHEEGRQRWLVLDSDGRTRGVLELPFGPAVPDFAFRPRLRGGMLAVAVRGSLGTPGVIVFELSGSPFAPDSAPAPP